MSSPAQERYQMKKTRSLGSKVTLLSFGLVTACAAQAPTNDAVQDSPEMTHSANASLPGAPFMGWSTWNFIGHNPTEANVEAQARAVASQLKSHGYNYILLDDFWYSNPATTVDANGRWAVDTSRFPNGLAGLASYLHGLGLEVGFYLTPGIPVAAVNQNTPIEGTSLHAKDIADTSRFETNYNFGDGTMYYIDYSKPGAQAFVDSWANLADEVAERAAAIGSAPDGRASAVEASGVEAVGAVSTDTATGRSALCLRL